MIKKAWQLIKRGAIFWIVVGILLALVFWVLGFLNTVIDYQFVADSRLNALVKIGIVMGVIIFTGVVFSLRWLKAWLLSIQNPVVLTLALLFFRDDVEAADNEDEWKEVIFPHDGHMALGVVTGKLDLPDDPYDPNSPNIKWCSLLGPPTPPIALTTQLKLVRERDVIYTGRTVISTSLTTATFGSKLKLDRKKFKIMKQKSPNKK